jgi:hypothetical protein
MWNEVKEKYHRATLWVLEENTSCLLVLSSSAKSRWLCDISLLQAAADGLPMNDNSWHCLSIYQVPDTILKSLCVLAHVVFTTVHEIDSGVIAIL